MTLTFDAYDINISPREERYFNITVETKYPNEVLKNFTPQEIIDNYEELEELYKLLKEKFEK